MDFELIGAIWLHTVALVIAWGYYGILARIVLPGLKGSLDGPVRVKALVAIEVRARPLVLLSVVLFLVTGVYLLVSNPHYAGLGNFGSAWSMLMLVKHLLVAGLIALAAAIDYLIRGLGEPISDAARDADVRLVTWGAEAATALGALIVLLTAAAQVTA